MKKLLLFLVAVIFIAISLVVYFVTKHQVSSSKPENSKNYFIVEFHGAPYPMELVVEEGTKISTALAQAGTNVEEVEHIYQLGSGKSKTEVHPNDEITKNSKYQI